MPYRTFSDADQYTDPIKIPGRFNVDIFSDPSGATVKLQKSVDGGATYYSVYDGTTEAAYTAKGGYTVENFGEAWFRLYCTAYGSGSFFAGISAGNTLGT